MESRVQHLRQYWYHMPVFEKKSVSSKALRLACENTIMMLCRNHGIVGKRVLYEFQKDGKGLDGGEIKYQIFNDSMAELYLNILSIMIAFVYSIPMHHLMGKVGEEGDFYRLLSRKIFSGIECLEEYMLFTRRRR